MVLLAFPGPNIAPQNVRIRRSSATVLLVSWRPLTLAEARGFVSHYSVTYSPPILSGEVRRQAAMTQRVEGMDVNTTTIVGVDPDSVYHVIVSATTGAGPGVLSDIISILPQGTVSLISPRASTYQCIGS